MPVSDPPTTPPRLASTNSTRRRTACGGAASTSDRMAEADSMSRRRRRSIDMSFRRHQDTVPHDDRHDEVERIQPQAMVDVRAGEVFRVLLEAHPRSAVDETVEQRGLVERRAPQAGFNEIGTGV